MSHINRTKSESDIMEHVFSDVLAREEATAHFPIVEIDVNPGFVSSTRSSMEVDVLAEPSHESTREPRSTAGISTGIVSPGEGS